MHRQVLYSTFAFCTRPDTFGLRENPASMTVKRPEPGAKPIDIFEPAEVLAVAEAARLGEHRGQGGYTHSRYSPETMAGWRRINEQDAALIVIAGFTAYGWASCARSVGKTSTWRTRRSRSRGRCRGTRSHRPSRGRCGRCRWPNKQSSPSGVSSSGGTSPAARTSSSFDRRWLARPLRGPPSLRRRAEGGWCPGAALPRPAAHLRQHRDPQIRPRFGSGDDGPLEITTTQRYLHSKPRPDDAAKLTKLFEAVV